jgi:endonuclease/exonuclease/phosphatase family metal-dependent hydrolase
LPLHGSHDGGLTIMGQFRVATFNLENFDETPAGQSPSLDERIALMRPQIVRLDADVACFQEVHGQERAGQPRSLHALTRLLAGTDLADATLVSTHPGATPGPAVVNGAGDVFDERNLVVATSLPVGPHQQLRNDLVAAPVYSRLTALKPDGTPDPDPVAITVERPILHVEVDLTPRFGPDAGHLHVINVHLKSKIPTDIPGQKRDPFTWKTADGWAEGTFISSLKRMSQALEVRRLVDQILTGDPDAKIVVAGDFNAEPDDVPVLAIRGDVEDTGNPALANQVLVPVEQTIPESSRYSLFHQGRGQMLDHLLITRNLLAHYRGSEIHNEVLHDESIAFGTDKKFPESDHAPVVATFQFD